MGQSETKQEDLPPLPQQQVVGAAQEYQAAHNSAPMTVATHEATAALRLDLVWDKASVRLSRVPGTQTRWSLMASFTAKVPCSFTCALHAEEHFQGASLHYAPVPPCPPTPPARSFPAGTHSVGLEGAFAIETMQWPVHAFWKYSNARAKIMPVVFQLRATDGTEAVIVISIHQKKHDLEAVILKQKVAVQGREYTLQEVFGLGTMGKDAFGGEESHDESRVGEPCVICMSEPRNTAILPCHHLCVCEDCGGRVLARAALEGTKCPICRGAVGDLKVFEVK